MTKSQAKEAVLRWLDEATAGGRALEEETTADYLDRMDHLLAGALAAVCGRFPRYGRQTVLLPGSDESWVEVRMPADFLRLQQMLFTGENAVLAPLSEYRQAGPDSYALPGALRGSLELHYIRSPRLPAASEAEDALLDVDDLAAPLVPLRLAADLLAGVDDTAALSACLYARYADMAAELHRRQAPACGTVECVYAM